MSSGAVEVKLSAAVGEFKAQLQDAARTLSATAKDMGTSLGVASAAAEQSGRSFGSFGEVLKHHRLEMRQESVMTQVLARDLSSLGLDAKGAGGEIAHLVGSFAIGGGLGLAIAAVKVLAEQFQKLGEDEREAAEEQEKWFEAIAKESEEAQKRIRDLQDKIDGLTSEQKLARSQMPIVAQIDEVEKKLGAAKKLLADLQEQSATPIQTGEIMDAPGLDDAAKRVQTLERELAALQSRRNQIATEASKEVTLGAQKWDADQAKEHARAVADANAKQLKDAEALAQAQYQLALAQGQSIDEADAKARKATDDRLEHERVAYYTEEAYGDQSRGKELAALEKYYRDQIVAAEGNVDQQLALQRQFSAEKQKILDQTAYDKSKTTAEDDWAKDWAEAIGTNFGHALGYMILEAQSFSDAITGIFKSMAAAVIDQLSAIAAKWMTVQALTGIRGLLGAGGGDTDMGGAGVLLSAAGGGSDWGSGSWFSGRASGGPVQFGRPYLIGESGPELFVPGASGTVVPNDALAGAGSTQHIHFHGTLIDRRAVEGFARTYARDIAKGLRG